MTINQKLPTSNRNKVLLLTCFALIAALSNLFLIGKDTVNAAPVIGFSPDRIIDDAVFTNSTSMDSGQIQAFLNSKVPICETWHAAGYGQSPPFTCLKDYSENGKSAAQIIFDTAQQYKINPQVFIVLLQKEQGLITDTWPLASQYRTATGYGCPDTAICDSQYFGLTNQLQWSGKMFRAILNNSSTWYTPYILGNNYIKWHPDFDSGRRSPEGKVIWEDRCGGSVVNIQNRSTQALYNYTPYQPNSSALNAGYGTGDACGAYGNRNFYLYFNDWFGSTIGPDYAWQIESFSYAGGDNRIAVGETETITLKARNIGRNPWYNHGENPIRLATWEPSDRTSSLFKTNRLATLQESVVSVGQIGTFTFTVKPEKLGNYKESLNLVSENIAYMPWTGLRPTIEVTSVYDWQVQNVVYENGTGIMEPGSRQLVTVVAKNTGSITWNKTSGPQIKLATWTPDRKSSVGSTWLSPSRVAYMNESTVAPGQTAGFQFYVTMPPDGGVRYEKLNLVAEGEQWLTDQGLTLYLYGNQYSWQPIWHSHSTGTANIARNTDFSVTLKAKNTGETTWYKNSSYPLLVSPSNPINRESLFYTSSWVSSTRTARLVEDSVAPSQEGTFIIPLRTPASPGKYTEYFRPVAEGLVWLNDPGFNVYINVQ